MFLLFADDTQIAYTTAARNMARKVYISTLSIRVAVFMVFYVFTRVRGNNT